MVRWEVGFSRSRGGELGKRRGEGLFIYFSFCVCLIGYNSFLRRERSL